MLKGFSFTFIALLSSIANAAQPLSKEAGWGGSLSLNVGYTQKQSQLDTDSENAVTNNLDNNGKSSGSAIVYPLGRIQYTFDSLNTQLFLGNSKDQVAVAQFQYELGLVHRFADNTKLTIAAFPKLALFSEAWEDPFVEGSARQKTDKHVGGGRVAIENVLGSPLTLKYSLASSSVDNEKSGQSQLSSLAEQKLLQRDSLYQRFEVETMLPIAKGWLVKPNLQYTHRNADGDANSFDLYKAQLTLLMFKDRHTLVTTIHAGFSKYQELNPIFDNKQDAKQAGIFSVYSYKKPFNWERWSWTVMAGYNKEDSDIEFYDNSSFIISTGVIFEY